MLTYDQYVDISLLITSGIPTVLGILMHFPSAPCLVGGGCSFSLAHSCYNTNILQLHYQCSIVQYHSNRCLETHLLMLNLVFAWLKILVSMSLPVQSKVSFQALALFWVWWIPVRLSISREIPQKGRIKNKCRVSSFFLVSTSLSVFVEQREITLPWTMKLA